MPSPITQKDYGKGRKPRNKGRKLPARPLTRDELHKLLAEFPRNTKRGSRNRAMVAVMAGAGLKVGQVVAMEFDHYDADRGEIILPGKGRIPESGSRFPAWRARPWMIGFACAARSDSLAWRHCFQR